jgi:hypothetical protein
MVIIAGVTAIVAETIVTAPEPATLRVSVAKTFTVPVVVPAVKVPVETPMVPRAVLLEDHVKVPVPPVAVNVCVEPFVSVTDGGETETEVEEVVKTPPSEGPNGPPLVPPVSQP